MLQAMFRFETDGHTEEDPTVNKLEKKLCAAECFKWGCHFFCPSGTMTNQIAIK